MNAISSWLRPHAADIVVDAPSRHRLLDVECISARKLSLDDAAQYRRNLASAWDLDADHFMFAFRAGLYLWRRETPVDAVPDFVSDPEAIWQSYVGRLAYDEAGGLRAESVKIAVFSWLHDLGSGIRKLDPHAAADQMLVRSGLYEQIKHAIVRIGDEP